MYFLFSIKFAIKSIITYLVFLSTQKFEQIFQIVYQSEVDKIESDQHIDQYLNWLQVTEMNEAGISFGSHACSHKKLTLLVSAEIEQELQLSYDKISLLKQNIPITIAYPNGNSNTSIQRKAKETGYSLAFGTEAGYVTKQSNLYDLKRLNMFEKRASNEPLFMMMLLGYF